MNTKCSDNGSHLLKMWVEDDFSTAKLKVGKVTRVSRSRMPPRFAAIAEELDDVIGRSRQHDNLRDEPVRARIGGMRSAFRSPGVPSTREAGTASLVGGPSNRPMRAGFAENSFLINAGPSYE
jgi:hypothetical protein